MIFDIGCGLDPKGYVNLDILSIRYLKSTYTIFKNIKNFIIGDCHSIPIRDNIFSVVYLSHVLEHLPRPDLCLNEIKRVGFNKVIIRVPNNPVNYEWKFHLFSWSKSSLENYLKLYFDKVIAYLYIGQKCELEGSHLIQITNRLGIFGKFLLRMFLWVCKNEVIAICYIGDN